MKKRLFSILSLLIIAALAFSTAAAAQPAPTPNQVVDKGLEYTVDTVYSEDSIKNAARLDDGRYSIIVQFSEPPLATYTGGVPGFSATATSATGQTKLDSNSADSQAYIQYLVNQQTAFTGQLASVAPSATVGYTYQAAFNGLTLYVDQKEISTIAMMSGVAKIYPNQVRTIEMDASIPLINAPALWAKLDGQENAGKGIKIADVDTGLDVKNPMFSGTGFSAPAGYPKGFCVTNPADPDFQCNGKVIVGRWYFDPALLGGGTVINPLEVYTPFGIEGHGTHTAGTAAGNQVDALIQGVTVPISGVAPAAYLMVYKGLFGVIRNGVPTGSGTDSMLVAALNAALLDGADVINNSWGGGAGDPNASLYKPLIAAITAAGTLVVFSAGNDGPAGGTIGCPGCVEDALTVAASTTNRIFANPFNVTSPTPVPVNLTNLGVFASGSIITNPISEEIRFSSANALGCDAFPAGFFTGSLALIGRGTCTFAVKVANAQAAGADAVVIYNNSGGPPVGMAGVPTDYPNYMIDMVNGQAVRDFILTSAPTPVTVTIDATISRITSDAYQDVMASFSSAGPNGDPNVLKPDITAPGVQILSATSPALLPGATEPAYELLQGTSMSAPHITGSAALLMQQHPDWTPWQVRTALTSTAVQTLVKPDGVTPANPFNMGSGRVDLERAGNAGLTFSKSSFTNPNCILTCSWILNVKNVTDSTERWDASVKGGKSFTVTVSPATLELPAGGYADVTVSVDASQLSPGSYVFSSVVWKNFSNKYTDAYLPIALASGTTTNASILNKTVDKATAQQGDTLTYSIKVSNPYPAETTYTLTDPLPDTLVYQDGTAVGLTYDPATRTLSGSTTLAPFSMDIVPTGNPTLYTSGNPATSLDLTANCPAADPTCDEVVFSITGVSIIYMGVNYTRVKVSSNGFLAFGTTAISSAATTQNLPNPAVPNNIIAPLWSDLEFAHAGAKWLIWGTPTQTVFEWQNANAFGNASVLYNFEIWFTDGTNEIAFAYGPLNADVATPSLGFAYEVGMENINGTAGTSYYYFSGAGSPVGTAPVMGTDLNIENNFSSTTMTFQANVDLQNPSLPVVTNMVTEVGNFDAQQNQALAYTTIKTFTINLPLVRR